MQKWIPISLAFNLWFIAAFLVYRGMSELLDRSGLRTTLHYITFILWAALFILLLRLRSSEFDCRCQKLAILIAGIGGGCLLWWGLPQLEARPVFEFVHALVPLLLWGVLGWLITQLRPDWVGAFNWLVCLNIHASPGPGTKDNTGMFATLAGFALAEGVALTAVAKGEGRDSLVLFIYAVLVVFSYFWTRQVLAQGINQQQFDQTTRIYGVYTLAWIVFLGTIMFTLGWYGVLPNQKWRSFYDRAEMACTMELANVYAKKQADKWILDASLAASASNKMLWIQTKSGFPTNYQEFSVDLVLDKRFTFKYGNAFLLSREHPNALPVYRQMLVTVKAGQCTITLEEPNENEFVVILCLVHDPSTAKIDSENNAWLVPHVLPREVQ